ncbi:MAG: flavodoxin domain-containing protein [Dehalococcoidia bacterium]|nr:flavodoxin domain-containing protein [Dehalococcoidia bacterium]
MENSVVVAYASKHGMTAEIAARIGETLRQAGLQVDILPVKRVKDLKKYGAAVLGSAIYITMWRKDMVKFLNSKEQQLSAMPVWLFSSGPLGKGDPLELSQGWSLPESLRPLIDRIKPRNTALFHGAIDIKKMGILEKWVIKNVKAPTGDFRDWEAVTAWANRIADALKKGG